MINYLIRRYLLMLVFAPFLLFTLVVYAPGGAFTTVLKSGLYPRDPYSRALISDFHLYKPWPLNYFAYLWDPGEYAYFDETAGQWWPKGTKVLGIPIRGSGAFSGDLGYSAAIEGLTVQDLIGDGLSQIAFAYLALLLALILWVSIMRFKRGYEGSVRPPYMPRDSHIPRFGIMPIQWDFKTS